MYVGGSVDGAGAHFGRRSVRIPARHVPEAVTRLLALFRDERQPSEPAPAFFKRVDPQRVETALADLAAFKPEDLREEDYRDLGSAEAFQLEAGEGECAT
jgi:sulfite reductase (ferredoxin)